MELNLHPPSDKGGNSIALTVDSPASTVGDAARSLLKSLGHEAITTSAMDSVAFTLEAGEGKKSPFKLPYGLWCTLPGFELFDSSQDTQDLLLFLRHNIPVDLVGTAIDVKVLEDNALVRVSLSYAAKADSPSSAFFFTLPHGAAVYSLAVTVQPPGAPATRVSAKVMEKGSAREAFRRAARAGRGAYLLETTDASEEVHRLRLGNLPAGAGCVVELCFVTRTLPTPGAESLLLLPRYLLHRYTPLRGMLPSVDPADTAGAVANAAARAAAAGSAHPPLTLLFSAHGRGGVSRLSSPSHAAFVTTEQPVPFNASARFLQLSIPATSPAGSPPEAAAALLKAHHDDIHLQVGPPKVAVSKIHPHGWLEDCLPLPHQEPDAPEGEGPAPATLRALRLSVPYSWAVPLFTSSKGTSMPLQVEFLIDCSGSMDESGRCKRASEMLQLFLRSLPAGSYFNITRFGWGFEILFDESKPLDKSSLEIADDLAKQLSPNMGGTEILRPLQLLTSTPRIPGLQKIILLLTDGQVSNTRDCVALAASVASAAKEAGQPPVRFFTVGVGSGSSMELVQGMAEASGGSFAFAPDHAPLAPIVMSMLARAVQTSFKATLVPVPGGCAPPTAASQHLPISATVQVGGRAVLYAFMPAAEAEAPPLPFGAHLLLESSDPSQGPVSVPLWCSPAPNSSPPQCTHVAVERTEGSAVRVSAVRAALASLAAEEDMELLKSPQEHGDDPSAHAAKLDALANAQVELSVAHSVLCRHTAFFAEEEALDRGKLKALRERWAAAGILDPFGDTSSSEAYSNQGRAVRQVLQGEGGMGAVKFHGSTKVDLPHGLLLEDCGITSATSGYSLRLLKDVRLAPTAFANGRLPTVAEGDPEAAFMAPSYLAALTSASAFDEVYDVLSEWTGNMSRALGKQLHVHFHGAGLHSLCMVENMHSLLATLRTLTPGSLTLSVGVTDLWDTVRREMDALREAYTHKYLIAREMTGDDSKFPLTSYEQVQLLLLGIERMNGALPQGESNTKLVSDFCTQCSALKSRLDDSRDDGPNLCRRARGPPARRDSLTGVGEPCFVDGAPSDSGSPIPVMIHGAPRLGHEDSYALIKDILLRQEADGSFDPASLPADALMPALSRILPPHATSSSPSATVEAKLSMARSSFAGSFSPIVQLTLLVLALLHAAANDSEATWRMCADRSHAFLRATLKISEDQVCALIASMEQLLVQ